MNDSYDDYLTRQGLGLNTPTPDSRDNGAAEPEPQGIDSQCESIPTSEPSESAELGSSSTGWGRAKEIALASGRCCLAVWRKRPKLSFALYVMVFALITAASVVLLQWSMYTEPEYSDPVAVDDTTKVLDSVWGRVSRFVSQIWLEQQYQALLNLLVLGALYLTLVLVINRFWVSTAIFGTTMAVFAVANHFKVQLRNEPIIPADLNFISGGNTGEIMSFVPASGRGLVNSSVTALIWFVMICVALQFLDRRSALIPARWRPRFYRRPGRFKIIVWTATRVMVAVLSASLMFSFVWDLGIPGSKARVWAASLSDSPQPWNGHGDATNNGPAMNFLRLIHTEVMDKPEGYDKAAMEELAERWSKKARKLNASRSTELTDNTVIMMLSESFSDPTRVPDISFDTGPMPYIRSLKETTTSGLMLSPGYGGGTANIEYQALTGLNMANYSSSLQIAYQQLVPNQNWTPSFNQLWNEANGDDASVALHSFNRNMYFRDTNYRKFGFSTFWASDGKYQMEGLTPLDAAWYASDNSTYRNVLDQVKQDGPAQFIQVVTMQNHMPYDDWYQDNEFKAADTSPDLGEGERTEVDTYAKGVSITDDETAAFLAELDTIDRPITVIFYGDHLPGIYATATSDPGNTTELHETDYFIWSNTASTSRGEKLSEADAGYTSSNYFMAQAAEHMNAKVSPYLAFLTAMHQAIPAISTPTASAESGDNPTYLNAEGNVVLPEDLSNEAQDLLEDYLLIQYDLSAGKQYLKDTDFTALP